MLEQMKIFKMIRRIAEACQRDVRFIPESALARATKMSASAITGLMHRSKHDL